MHDKGPGSKGRAKKPKGGKGATKKGTTTSKDALNEKRGVLATKSGASGQK